EAADDYRRVVEIDPSHDAARLDLAELLIAAHKALEAEPHFEFLRQRHPDQADVLLGLARCKIELKLEEEGRQLLDEVLQSQPGNVQALTESGRLLIATQDFIQAEARLRKALALSPNNREALYNLYRCLNQQQKSKEAGRYKQLMDQVD